MGPRFSRLGWQGIVAVDLLMKKLLETRPYEKERGATDRVYQDALTRICDTIREGGDQEESLRKSIGAFDRIAVDKPGTKPLIGIVGEIFVRSIASATRMSFERSSSMGRSLDRTSDGMDSLCQHHRQKREPEKAFLC